MLARTSLRGRSVGSRLLSVELKGRTALVTGSTAGIGLGIARSLAAEGCNVMLNGFGDAAEIEATRSAIASDFGVKVSYSGADMRSPDAIAEMVQRTEAELGPCDVLVNNAGIQRVSTVEAFTDGDWADVVDINLSAVFRTTRAVLPSMRARGFGRILNVASVHGLVASSSKSAYVAAKHGVVGLTKTTALETAGSGVTCNAICPGWTLTKLVQDQIDALAQAKGLSEAAATRALLEEKQPSCEFVTTDQLGALAVFLASPHAAQITGASIPVDGGWTAR